MAKKVKVNQDLCISCSTCWVLDSAHFGQGTDGKAKVKNGTDDLDLQVEKEISEEGTLESAVSSCPVGAITVE